MSDDNDDGSGEDERWQTMMLMLMIKMMYDADYGGDDEDWICC